MNELVQRDPSGNPFTTSLDIAYGVKAQHKNVIELVKKNLQDFEEFAPVTFETRVANRQQGGGSNTTYAVLTEDQATLLMTYMRNNDVVRKFKKALVKAFRELNQQLQQPKPSTELTRMEILRMALEAEQEKERLQAKIEQDAPLVEFANQVEITTDSISVSKAAKIIGTGQNRLFKFLRENKWVTRRNEPYQEKIAAGLLDVKLGQWEHPERGLQESITTMVTGKGLRQIQLLWSQRRQVA